MKWIEGLNIIVKINEKYYCANFGFKKVYKYSFFIGNFLGQEREQIFIRLQPNYSNPKSYTFVYDYRDGALVQIFNSYVMMPIKLSIEQMMKFDSYDGSNLDIKEPIIYPYSQQTRKTYNLYCKYPVQDNLSDEIIGYVTRELIWNNKEFQVYREEIVI